MFYFIVDMGTFFISFIFLRHYRASLSFFFSMPYSVYIFVACSITYLGIGILNHITNTPLLMLYLYTHRDIAYIALSKIGQCLVLSLPAKYYKHCWLCLLIWVGIYFFTYWFIPSYQKVHKHILHRAL